MPETLRDRITASMKERAERDTDWMFADLADAVIRELGLTCERLGESTGYPHPQTRYVTEWSDE